MVNGLAPMLATLTVRALRSVRSEPLFGRMIWLMKVFARRVKLPGRRVWAAGVGLLLLLATGAYLRIRPVMPDFQAFPAHSVTRPSPALGLDPFYEKYLNTSGIALVSSAKVPDEALVTANEVIGHMLANRPDMVKAMAAGSARVAIISKDEKISEVPEYTWIWPKSYWNKRARGFGGHWFIPVTVCDEENMLGDKSDPWKGECILIHEFAHAVHEHGMHTLDGTFDGRLKRTYQAAMAAGLWHDTYAITDRKEYWAEGVQCYFDSNIKADPPNGVHNAIRTREALEAYDPALFNLIDEVFAKNPWQWKPNGVHAQRWQEK
jgi:hypothetical protein